MKSKLVKVISFITGVIMVSSVFVGCTNKGKTVDTKVDYTTGTVTYPIKTENSLTYWVGLNANVSASVATLNDTEFAKELIKETGIKVTFQHPAQGQESQTLNIMIASKELPDIIEYNWFGYTGGPEKAIQDGAIIKTNDLMDKYAPNYKKVLASDAQKAKMSKTDDGSYYGFGFFRGVDNNTVFYGPVLRGDWLKDLNLNTPVTLDEFEKTLIAFKDKKGATAPLTMSLSGTLLDSNFVVGAYGIGGGWYIDDNKKVAYGPADPKFKDYLTTMNRWYKDGLLDKNFASNNGNAMNANMLNGKSGATLGYIGSGIGTLMNAMKVKDPKFDLTAVQYPVLNQGDPIKFAQKDWEFPGGTTAAITPSCKNPEIATRLLDYGYSTAGNLLYNFGIEGESYNMVNGVPTYTDLILNNPNKLSIAQAMGRYTRSNYVGPLVQEKGYLDQYYTLPQQKDAIKLWMKANPYPNQYPSATPIPSEIEELAPLESDINTYVSEMESRFIMGSEPLSNFDKFESKLKTLNIDRVTQLRQASVDRYNKR